MHSTVTVGRGNSRLKGLTQCHWYSRFGFFHLIYPHSIVTKVMSVQRATTGAPSKHLRPPIKPNTTISYHIECALTVPALVRNGFSDRRDAITRYTKREPLTGPYKTTSPSTHFRVSWSWKTNPRRDPHPQPTPMKKRSQHSIISTLLVMTPCTPYSYTVPYRRTMKHPSRLHPELLPSQAQQQAHV